MMVLESLIESILVAQKVGSTLKKITALEVSLMKETVSPSPPRHEDSSLDQVSSTASTVISPLGSLDDFNVLYLYNQKGEDIYTLIRVGWLVYILD